MMRGRGNSYPPHGRHINDAFPGLWPLRFRRSQLKLRRQQYSCCQFIFNCPFYGGQAPPPAYPASTPPSKPVRPHVALPKIPMGFSGRGVAGCCRRYESYIFPRVPENASGTRAEYRFFTARRDPATSPAPDTPRPWCPR